DGIDWVIAGGESGARSREIKGEWVSEIRDQCVDQGVPFFFKHWGGRNKKKAGNILDGEVWVQMPELVYS
ncbi:MAG: phage Gp37/Gp68 family protein, partial [Spirochaetota bacterium]|nr:phage Gp37/Gp68 family protein [Spirochaetota bacterium]